MPLQLNRRQLLKRGLVIAGSMQLAPGLFNMTAAGTINSCRFDAFVSDKMVADNAPVDLKARLYANENPFGPSDKAKKAIEQAMTDSFRYPFIFAREFAKKIADFEGLSPEHLLLGAGSSPLLLASAMHFGQKPNANIISADPSYEDLPFTATEFGAKWVKVPLTAEYKTDLDAMERAIDANTSLVYICNPNNPTATVIDAEKLRAFIDRVSPKVTVFIDEAYIDYLDDSASKTVIGKIKEGKNIIVARTFSKLYGFAGLRVGYVFAQPELIKKLSVYTDGFAGISTTSLHAAMVSYQDKEYLKGALDKTIASKNFLYEVLKKEGYEYIPSSANFVLFPLKMDSKQFVTEMGKRGVGVRSWQFNAKEWCRVSIGRMDEMEAFATAFKEIS